MPQQNAPAAISHSCHSFVFKTDRPWPNRRLCVGAIVGHSTPKSTRLWLRTGSLGSFTLLCYPWVSDLDSQEFRSILREVPCKLSDIRKHLGNVNDGLRRQCDFEVKDYSNDTTCVVDLDGLQPNKYYGYLLWAQEQQRVLLGHNRLRFFRTPRSHPKAFQFAVISCHRPYETIEPLRGPPGRRRPFRRDKRTKIVNMGMWESLGDTLRRYSDRVDFVIAAGDQCYVDADTLNIWSYLKKALQNMEEPPTRETMLSWYRDIYRGYWGFEAVQSVFDRFPTYMIWDDHEIVDGWGSHMSKGELLGDPSDFAELDTDKWSLATVVNRMVKAAKDSYNEYQHAHNPSTASGQWDYHFRHSSCSFFVLDGRGNRDIEQQDYRILGSEQFQRFKMHVKELKKEKEEKTKLLFVVSAVPLLHLRASVLKQDEIAFGMADDLRDAWEHENHAPEYNELLGILFDAAQGGIGVCVVSGEVHMSAAFEIRDGNGHRIYQLTASAITASDNAIMKWLVEKLGMAEEGRVGNEYSFKRLALYRGNSYAVVDVDFSNNQYSYKIYGRDGVEAVVPLTFPK